MLAQCPTHPALKEHGNTKAWNIRAVPIPAAMRKDIGVQLRSLPMEITSPKNGVTATWRLPHATRKVRLAFMSDFPAYVAVQFQAQSPS